MTQAQAYPWEAPVSETAAAMARSFREFVPALQTERLVLRAPRLEDFPTYAEILMTSPAEAMGGPFDREAALLDFSQYVAGWLLRGIGLWAVERRSDEALIGFVLVGMEHGDLEPELGYLFTEASQGQGYATEATRAARDFALQDLELPVLVSYVSQANLPSQALAQRLGAWRDSQAEAGFQDDVTVWRHAPKQGDLT